MFSIFFAEITASKLLSQDHLDHLEDLEDLDDLEDDQDFVAPHAPKLGQANVTSDLELAEDDAEDDQLEEEEDQVDDEEVEDDVVEDEDEEEDASQLGMLQTNRTLSSASRRRLVYRKRCHWTAPLKNMETRVKQEGRLKNWKLKFPYQWTRPMVRLRFKNKRNQFRVTHWRRVKEYRFRVKGNKLCVEACMESRRMRDRFHRLIRNDPRGIRKVRC